MLKLLTVLAIFALILWGQIGRSSSDVLVIELKNSHESGSDLLVKGFANLDIAKEYARRRVRDSIEELRSQGMTPTQLQQLWTIYGEDASVVKGNYKASSELDFFLQHPATPQERDWETLEKENKVVKEKMHRAK